jgi:single-stranded-DNA-specific exonuclease
MRSSGGENLIELMGPVSEFANRLGGHPGAIGVTVTPANLSKFIKACDEIEWIPVPKSKILDFGIETALRDPDEIEELNRIQPCGEGNPEPEFMWGPVYIENTRAVGKELDHIQFIFSAGSSGSMKGIGFSMAQYFKGGNQDRKAYLAAGQFIVNDWMGDRAVEFQVSDLDEMRPDSQAV